MANNKLYCSSMINGVIQLLFLNYYNVPIYFHLLINLGILTSILNHKFSNKYLKYLDRITMTFGVISHTMDIYNIFNEYDLYFNLYLSVIFYFLAKVESDKRESNICHIFSHIFLTIVHYKMSFKYHYNIF